MRSDLSQLSKDGDAFAFLDLPPGAHVGCDTLVGTTNQEATELADSSEARDSNAPEVTGVCGFRDIPPGAHFAWVSAPGAMSRQGCWFIAQRRGASDGNGPSPGVVRTKKWDRFHEVLTEFDYSSHDQASTTGELAAAFSQLIPYTTGSEQKDQKVPAAAFPGQGRHDASNDIELWRQLTSCITAQVLGRIAGAPGTTAATPNEWLFSTTDTAKDEVAMMGGVTHSNAGAGASAGSHNESSEFHFLFAKDDLDAYRLIAQEKKKDGHDADSTDPDSSDTTERILALIDHAQSKLSEADLIGQVQFAFLTGIVLSNLSCLEQWWHFVLRVFLRARHLVARRPSLCRAFLATLVSQLTYLERFTAGKITRLSPRTGLVSESSDAADGSDRATSIFDAKPQGAVRLRAALAVFRRQFKFSSNDDAHVDEKSILSTSLAEASASEAFMDLEALLWKYGWDLSGSGERQDKSEAEAVGKGKRTDYNEDNDDDELEIYDTPLKEGAQEGTRRANVHSALSDSDDDDDDYLPVVVEMDEHGNEVGLVSWD